MILFRKKNSELINRFSNVLNNKINNEREFDEELLKLSTIIQNSKINTNRKLDIYNYISMSRNSRGKDREKYLKKLRGLL